jgi:hypothetical protein
MGIVDTATLVRRRAVLVMDVRLLAWHVRFVDTLDVARRLFTFHFLLHLSRA